jgi:hypothetical protein
MTRKRATPGFDSRDLVLDADVDVDLDLDVGVGAEVDVNLKRSAPPSGSPNLLGINANQVLNTLGITLPISGVTQSTNLVANLNICLGDAISETQSLLDDTTGFIKSLLSLLLEFSVDLNVDLTPSTPANPSTISLGLQLCGLGDSIDLTLSQTLNKVANLLNVDLVGITIAIEYTGGSGCPVTTTPLPPPSNPATNPDLSVTSLTLGLGASIDNLLGQVDPILADLGLGSINLGLDTTADLTVDISVGLSNTLSSVDGLVDKVFALVGKTLNLSLVTDLTLEINPGPTPSPMPSDPSIIVDIDLSPLVSYVSSDLDGIVHLVLSVVSEVIARLLDVGVVVNVDGGSSCGCSGSRQASPKTE